VTDPIRRRSTGRVVALTLARPDKLNALDAEMVVGLRRMVDAAMQDPHVGAIVLDAEGRAFCAGQDLSLRYVPPGASPLDLGASLEEAYNPLVRSIRYGPKPVVSAVQGVAAGAGASLAMAADVVIAATDARFVEAFSRVGLMPDGGGTWLLPHAAGRARALAAALLGSAIDAATAKAWGLVWEVVPAAALGTVAMAVAERLATFGPNDLTEMT